MSVILATLFKRNQLYKAVLSRQHPHSQKFKRACARPLPADVLDWGTTIRARYLRGTKTSEAACRHSVFPSPLMSTQPTCTSPAHFWLATEVSLSRPAPVRAVRLLPKAPRVHVWDGTLIRLQFYNWGTACDEERKASALNRGVCWPARRVDSHGWPRRGGAPCKGASPRTRRCSRWHRSSPLALACGSQIL